MSAHPEITVHALPPSHPCMTVRAALDRKGLAYELQNMDMGKHNEQMAEIYGEGNVTVPGAVIDGEPVHGSTAILAKLEQLYAEPSLYPEPNAAAIREAEEWGDGHLQDLGRRLPWGVMYFRPEAMGTFAGGDPLDPAGTDFAMRFIRASWKYHKITAERLAADLASLPEQIAHIESLAADGIIGGDEPNAADLQIGATIRVLLPIGDLKPLLEGTQAERIALANFPDYPGHVPAGAFPAGWVPFS